MSKREDICHETIEGNLTGIERSIVADVIAVNGQRFGITKLILDNLPTDVMKDIVRRLDIGFIDPGFKIQIFLDLKVKVVRE